MQPVPQNLQGSAPLNDLATIKDYDMVLWILIQDGAVQIGLLWLRILTSGGLL
jgi:hypothetical protein